MILVVIGKNVEHVPEAAIVVWALADVELLVGAVAFQVKAEIPDS